MRSLLLFHSPHDKENAGNRWHVTNKRLHSKTQRRFLHLYLEAFSVSRTFGEEEQPVVFVVPHLKVLQRAPVDVLPYQVL